MNKIRLSFKKHAKETGLSAIGNPYPPTDIKINKKICGVINPPAWRNDNNWNVGIMIIKNEKDSKPDTNKNTCWRWIFFAKEFEKEELARIWVNENIERWSKKWDLYLEGNEDD